MQKVTRFASQMEPSSHVFVNLAYQKDFIFPYSSRLFAFSIRIFVCPENRKCMGTPFQVRLLWLLRAKYHLSSFGFPLSAKEGLCKRWEWGERRTGLRGTDICDGFCCPTSKEKMLRLLLSVFMASNHTRQNFRLFLQTCIWTKAVCRVCNTGPVVLIGFGNRGNFVHCDETIDD